MTHNWVWKILLELFIEAKDQDQSCVLVDGPSMTAKEVLFSKPYRPAGLQAEIDKAVAKAIGESEWGSHHGKGQDGGSLKMRCETCTENVGNFGDKGTTIGGRKSWDDKNLESGRFLSTQSRDSSLVSDQNYC